MVKKITLGDDPLAIMIPEAPDPEVEELHPDKKGKKETACGKKCPKLKINKKKLKTTKITEEAEKRIKSAVYWTPGETELDLINRAINTEIDRMEKERLKPFPEAKIPKKWK